MATGGVIVLRFSSYPSYSDINTWRRNLLNEFGPDDFLDPIMFDQDLGHALIPVDDGSFWFDVGVIHDYYGEGYERGDAEWFIRLAEWLERNIPGCEIWYGNDSSDESIKPFGIAERAAFLEYFRQVGHEPYDARHREHRANLVALSASPKKKAWHPSRIIQFWSMLILTIIFLFGCGCGSLITYLTNT
jgi:hypothetical protein